MAHFKVVVFDPQTRKRSTVQIEAENEQAATADVVNQGLTPINISQTKIRLFSFSDRVKVKDRVIFSNMLSVLVNAGLPLLESLEAVGQQTKNKPLKKIVTNLIKDVRGGNSLSDAMSKYPRVFNQIFVGLVDAGEQSGNLDVTLSRLADQQEKDAVIIKKIIGALFYPAIVVTLIFGVIVFLMVYVIPIIQSVYESSDRDLNNLTKTVILISNSMKNWWFVYIAVIFGTISFAIWGVKTTDIGRAIFDRLKLRIPLIKDLSVGLYMTRFCRILGLLTASSILITDSLVIASKAVNNVVVSESILKARAAVIKGEPLSKQLKDDPLFPYLISNMVQVGEQSGSLDQMLNKAADHYESDVDEKIKGLTTIIEPILIITLGGIVGVLFFAVLMPMLNAHETLWSFLIYF